MTKLKQSLAPKSNNIKKMYRGEEGLLPRASPNLSVVALRTIAQGYRPKKLRETHRSRPFTTVTYNLMAFI
jgi:hypothetical protein